MNDKDVIPHALCAEMIELITSNLIKICDSESQALKIIKIGVEKALYSNKNK